MSRVLRSYFLILLFALDIFCVRGQEPEKGLKNITERFAAFSKSIPFEDIFLHTDRNIYIAGEYLWISTYLFDRQNSSLSDRSSYAYIELLNPDNQPVSQIKIRLENGTGSGGFVLPDSLSNGEYTLRAYTNWMKNFLPDGCFIKKITVYNHFSERHFWTHNAEYQTNNTISAIDFFPEGGNILSGFKNKVGLRIYNKSGYGIGCKGVILDQANDTLTDVVVDSTGIGSFEFIPSEGKIYRLETENGKQVFNLPAISQTGYSIQISNSESDSVRLTVNTDMISLPENKNFIYLAIQSNGRILFTEKETVKGKSTRIVIPFEKLVPGINELIIFDPDANPVCNRYIFNPLPTTKNIAINSGDRFGKRVKIELEVDPGSGSLSSAGLSKFSVSVSASDANDRNNELSDYAILGNEYKMRNGVNFNPINLSAASTKLIDNFLLSTKSIWIDWGKIISGNLPEIKNKFEKNGQILSGIIKTSDNTLPDNNMHIYLSVPGKSSVFKYTTIDSENRFSFFIRDNENSKDLIIQTADNTKNYSLIIEFPFSQRYPEPEIFNSSLKTLFTDEIIKWSTNYQINKIYEIAPFNDTLKPGEIKPQSLRFYGKPDLTLKLSDYISLPVMQEVFFELIPGVTINTEKSKYGIYMQDPLTKKNYDKSPALFIDGVTINDPAAIINLDPELVEKIDIIKSEYIVGDVIFSGIVNVITKAGDFSNADLPRNAVRIKNTDHNTALKFKFPDYSSSEIRNSRIPDFRNTLYWNPDLKPDKNGKLLIEVSTSDFSSDYEVIFQGVSNGRVVFARKTIRVE